MSKAFSKIFKKNTSSTVNEKTSATSSRGLPPNRTNPFSRSSRASPSEPMDAPPPYTANQPSNPPQRHSTVNSLEAARSRISTAVNNKEDRFEFLAHFDTIFLVDDSASMRGPSWEQAAAVLSQTAEKAAQYDDDGIDMYFLNNETDDCPAGKGPGGYYNLKRKSKVDRIFRDTRPYNGTPTGERLKEILEAYVWQLDEASKANKKVKPINIIVITDGKPNDNPKKHIVDYANALDKREAAPWQVGIMFFQVGNEPGAEEALAELDDQLKQEHGCRDMVDRYQRENPRDTSPLTSDELLKALGGAIQKKLDRKKIVGGELA